MVDSDPSLRDLLRAALESKQHKLVSVHDREATRHEGRVSPWRSPKPSRQFVGLLPSWLLLGSPLLPDQQSLVATERYSRAT